MHALLTPFMMIAVTYMGRAGGIRWLSTRAWTIVVWVLVIGGIIEGALAHLIGLQLEAGLFQRHSALHVECQSGAILFRGPARGAGFRSAHPVDRR